MKFDSYTLKARLFPAVIGSIPFFVLYHFFLLQYFSEFFKLIFGTQWVGDISIGIVFLFLFAFLGRTIAKDIFEKKWFQSNETKMPTTDFLLHSNMEYSIGYKSKIHQKIKTDFDITILSAEMELKNIQLARKIIAESVVQIRHHIKDGRLLLARNIEYGFIRNIIGCSIIAIIISLLNILIFTVVKINGIAFITSIVLVLCYALPVLFGKKLMLNHGRRYARTLYQEYISG